MQCGCDATTNRPTSAACRGLVCCAGMGRVGDDIAARGGARAHTPPPPTLPRRRARCRGAHAREEATKGWQRFARATTSRTAVCSRFTNLVSSKHFEPLWHNGQGLGLLIQRLRARVLQGVSGALHRTLI